MSQPPFFPLLVSLLFFTFILVSSYDGPLYDSSAYTECKMHPESPLYHGGILKDQHINGDEANSSSFTLKNLEEATMYCFSIWIRISGAKSAAITASLVTQGTQLECIGTVTAHKGCWSFLKGGFVLTSPSNSSMLYLKSSDNRDVGIETASASLQPFTQQQWRLNQDTKINQVRKRAVTVHVSNREGREIEGAVLRVEQVSKDFPFGSAIASSIIGNLAYQKWFVERFNAAVFENELKWNATEFVRGQLNYTLPDQMLEFVRANQMTVRGHNIFWENPKYIPKWVLNLTGPDLESAVNSRIQSLMHKYKGEFIHWDVSNEMLHFDFYEERLGPDATLQFFKAAHQADPLATLFMNEFNVVETCTDAESTVDAYVSRMRELKKGGVSMDGIGVQGHFDVPNPPLMRGVLDKLATLGLPIWLTEVDISSRFDKETQAVYLEEVVREGFSHAAVDGIVVWGARRRGGCYQMCLTDGNFSNLPTGEAVDRVLKEWSSGVVGGRTDERGAFSFFAFLGEYKPRNPRCYSPYRAIHARIRSLTGQVTLEEKMATPEIMRDFSIGSLLSGGGGMGGDGELVSERIDVVVSYSSLNGLKMHANKDPANDFLKGVLGSLSTATYTSIVFCSTN